MSMSGYSSNTNYEDDENRYMRKSRGKSRGNMRGNMNMSSAGHTGTYSYPAKYTDWNLIYFVIISLIILCIYLYYRQRKQ